MSEKPILNTKEAAEFLRAHPVTIRNWAREGRIPHAKIGKSLKFIRADLDKMLKKASQPGR